ncbi:MAG: PDZ domain-containing protein [Nitrospirae bacterium]|nr:MAG: PDZ domain-containing protein [Nitrospirota bacterium]
MISYSRYCFPRKRPLVSSLAGCLAASFLLISGCASSPSSSFPPGCQPWGEACIHPIYAAMPPMIDHAVLRLAVLPLSENGMPDEIKSTAGQAALGLKKSFPRLEIVERVRIDMAIHELEFQASGRVRDDNFVGVGRMLGADHLFIYQVTGDLDRDKQAFRGTGGLVHAMSSGKVIHVQTGALVFQQTVDLYATVPLPQPGNQWNDPDSVKLNIMRGALGVLFIQLEEALLPFPIGVAWGPDQGSNRVIAQIVMVGGPAHDAGLQRGDLLIVIDGIPVRGGGDRVLQDLELIPRELVQITIQRNGREQTLAVRPIRRNTIENSSSPGKQPAWMGAPEGDAKP